MVNDKNSKGLLSWHEGGRMPQQLWAFDDYTEVEDRPGEFATGLTSLGFIRAALRRSSWLWRGLAALGLVAGVGLFFRLPTVYQASTSLLLTPMATGGEDAGAPITNEVTVAQSREVAGLAVSKLGLRESASKFLTSYTVTPTTDRVLFITVSAPSSSDAVNRANVLAEEFLQYRAGLLESEQLLVVKSLDQQINQAQQNLKSITAQVAQVSAQTPSPAQRARLSGLTKQRTEANTSLTTLQQAAAGTKADSQVTTATIVHGSRVLDQASPLPPHSRLKRLLEYAAIGLIAGLALGVGIIVIRAIISDRLRRRDDVAQVLGAPVKLSVGAMRSGRSKRLDAAQDSNVRRIAGFLSSAIPAGGDPAGLAVVPVDDVHIPALCLVSTAVSHARKGTQVVVADLCDGAPAARLLGAAEPGVRTVTVQDARLVVMVPEPGEVVPPGPLRSGADQVRAAEPLVAACRSADLLLTLAPLDPSLGGEYLSGWAHGVVAIVTAGQSSAARIHAVGEMVRMAGTPLIAGVLIGADKSDESLGATTIPPEADRRATAAERPPNHDTNGFFVTVDDGLGGRSSDDR
jgi:capsular polysaccharide biosynthesis protein